MMMYELVQENEARCQREARALVSVLPKTKTRDTRHATKSHSYQLPLFRLTPHQPDAAITPASDGSEPAAQVMFNG